MLNEVASRTACHYVAVKSVYSIICVPSFLQYVEALFGALPFVMNNFNKRILLIS